MKHLLLFLLFSGSLDGFSQKRDTTQPLQQFDATKWQTNELVYAPVYRHDLGQPCKCSQCMTKNKPDTLRAICLVTMCRKCAAEPMAGFVVIAEGKEVEYLDCRKRALKLPQVGWGYRVVNPNEKLK